MSRKNLEDVRKLLSDDPEWLRPMVQSMLQDVLEAEMSEHLGADKHERTGARRGYRAGYYRRNLITRVGARVSSTPRCSSGINVARRRS